LCILFIGRLNRWRGVGRAAVVRSAVLASIVATTAAPALALAADVQQAHVACLRAALGRSEEDVRVVALQGLRSLLLTPPFAAELVPDVAVLLSPAVAAALPAAVGQEAVKVLAALVAGAPSDTARAAAIAVAVPALVGALGRPDGAAATGALPDACVQAILQFAPSQPQLFKETVAQLPPADKARLEAAIRQAASGANRARAAPAAAPATPSAPARPAVASAPAAAPTIQLTMSFANFA
jgi:hypothetical protein